MITKKGLLPILAACCCACLLLFHAYYYCHAAFAECGLTAPVLDRLARAFARVAIFSGRDKSKFAVILLLVVVQVGNNMGGAAAGRAAAVRRLILALVIYFGSDLVLMLTGDPVALASVYLLDLGVGLGLVYRGLKPLTGWLQVRLSEKIFNRYNESFPQEERHLSGPLVMYLEGLYRFRDQTRSSVINLVNIMRGTMVMGTPGSGKTRYIIRPLIRQSVDAGMALFVYDLKYPDLTTFTWRCWKRTSGSRKFYSLNFDDLGRSHRCNPLHPSGVRDISDAAEYSDDLTGAE